MLAKLKTTVNRIFTPQIIFILLAYIVTLVIIVAIWDEYVDRLNAMENSTYYTPQRQVLPDN